MSRRNRIAALLAATALSLSGCAGDEAERLVASLSDQPGRSPPPLGEDEQAVLVELEVGPGGIVPVGRPILQPGTRLELEVELARRRTEAPPYWIVLSSPDGAHVRYWTAASGQARVHTTARRGSGLGGSMKRLEGGIASIRLPFVAAGRIEVFDATGRRKGSFRFGDRPDVPIAGSVGTSKEGGCPQVWRIHGGGGPGHEFGILFVGDGFTQDELPVYRCAVAQMTEALAKRPPYDGIAHAINVYRMDLVTLSSGIEVPSSCPQGAPAKFGPFTATNESETLLAECSGDALAQGVSVNPPDTACAECARTNLGFFNDPEVSPDCRVVWTRQNGFRRVWALTRCAPDVDIVIVVANSTAHAGAGSADSAPPIAVATLWNVATDNWHDRLLAHELGHALGLLDEYATATGEAPEFQGGRNVVRRLPDGSIEPAPWADQCADELGRPTETCRVVHGPTALCKVEHASEQELPQVGLIEGAFYSACGFFRAQGTCLYNNAEERNLCVGCTTYLRKLLRDLGLRRDDGSLP